MNTGGPVGRWLLIFFSLAFALSACDPGPAEPETRTLVAWSSGWGDVTPPSGSYDNGRTLTLTAEPHEGWAFSGWSGAVETMDNPLTLKMDSDVRIVAHFEQPSPYGHWNGTAVRKVLQTFAWGGFPTDQQIATWAAMEPTDAIAEMLTFAPTNDKLSPPDFDALGAAVAEYVTEDGGQLEAIARYFADDPDDLIDPNRRAQFDLYSPSSPEDSWEIAARARGLNTFLHRVGFWETNYHMATIPTLVVPAPMIRHYDNITSKLTADAPYHEVLGRAAVNAGIAYQYGHNYNRWDMGEFYGNEDFAREYHQLFFGINGDVAYGGQAYHDNHEFVTIKNTAKALTGLSAYYLSPEAAIADVEIDFMAEIDTHHADPLTILDQTIEGETAKEKFEALSVFAIEHPESLDNLPVMIVSGLADDNLTEEKIAQIRALWREMPEKNLLTFLRQYAISDLFHSEERVRYHTSFDRLLFVHNQMQLGNHELYMDVAGLNPLFFLLHDDLLVPFHPVHAVFGHQSTHEAFADGQIFKNAYNQSSEASWYLTSGPIKDWQQVIPPSASGEWRVKDVARWLWQRFVADGLKNYGPLEQAHLHALLGSRTEDLDIPCVDLGLFLNASDPTRVYTQAELESEPVLSKIVTLGEQTLALGAEAWTDRRAPNTCIQRAISFIAATPYVFLQEGN